MSLNVNSPTVQAMMQNTPQGMGNLPMYYGSTPTITTQTTPFPSPKEMLVNAGQENVYAQTSMIRSPNIIGGPNPGFNAAFSGYTNPYMGYGYSGYGMGGYIPMDEQTKLTLQLAQENGLTYKEQLDMESILYKKMVRLVGVNTGHTEEEIQRAESEYDVKEKQPARQDNFYREPIPQLHIKIKVGDEEIADINTGAKVGYIAPSYLDQIDSTARKASEQFREAAAKSYQNAIERQADNADLVDFFNNHAGAIMMNELVERSRLQSMSMAAQMYSKEKFAKLLKNNGLKNRAQENALERYVGRYGVLPNGMPVSPGHDPSIADCFSYNRATGSVDIAPPNFFKNELEKARGRFLESIK